MRKGKKKFSIVNTTNYVRAISILLFTLIITNMFAQDQNNYKVSSKVSKGGIQDNLVYVAHIGGPTLIFEIDGVSIMTDPTLDEAGNIYQMGKITLEKIKSPIKQNISKVDFVLLSHDQHYDNLDNNGRKLLESVSQVYTTMVGSERLKGKSIGLHPWGNSTIMTPNGTEIIITATPARHGPAGIEPITGDVIGFVLTIKRDGLSIMEIYITGDTTYYKGVEEVSQKFNPQYVFIYAGAAQTRGSFNLTMGTNDAIDTAAVFPNSIIIPAHCDGWKHYTQNVEDFKKSFDVLGISDRLKVLDPGVRTMLNAQ